MSETGPQQLPRRAQLPPPQAVAELTDELDSYDELRDPQRRPARSPTWRRRCRGRSAARRRAAGPALAAHLGGVDPAAVTDRAALARLPVLRKSALGAAQAARAALRRLRRGRARRLRPRLPEPRPDLRAGRPGARLVAARPLPARLRHRPRRHGAELLRLPPDPRRHDVRERRRGGRRHGAARRHRPDRAAGPRGARPRLHRLRRHAGLPEGDPRQGRRAGADARASRRAAVSGGALFPSLRAGLRRPRHRLPAVLRHRRPRA